jgi:hypothetical protein
MPAPDAGPDAPPGAFDCIGDPFPTTAPGTITISGVTNEISTSGQAPLAGIDVEAFDAAGASLGSMVSDGTGAYSLSLTTGGTPLDGYLVGTSANASYDQITYVYPPAPLSSDQANVPVLMVGNTVWGFLPLLADATQQDANGFVGILVTDCFGSPVAGASVTVPGAATIRYISGTSVSQTATTTDSSGLALAFDVTPGDVTVDASTADYQFHEHTIEVRGGSAAGGVITTTIVAPGPISGIAP